MIRFFLLIAFLLSCRAARADFGITEHLLINDGQANNYIRSILQDDNGQVWIATDSGLNCFDGSEYFNFNTFNSALNSNMINCLYYDRYCRKIWIGTKGKGICAVDINTRQIERRELNDLSLSNVKGIYPSSDERFWIVSQDNIIRYDCKSGESVSYKKYIPDAAYQCLLDDGNGHLMIGQYLKGISILELKTKKLLALPGMDNHAEPNKNFNKIYKDHNGRVWVATNFGLWYYDPIRRVLSPFLCQGEDIQGNYVSDILEARDNELWVATETGISIVDLPQMTVLNIPSGPKPYGLVHNILALYQDNFGNIWVGSKGNGIDFISHDPSIFHSVCNIPIWGIYKDGDCTWVGSINQIHCYQEGRLVRSLDIRTSGKRGIALSINGDNNGNLLVSAYDRLLRVDKATGHIEMMRLEDGTPIAPMTFYHADDNTLWISTTDGITAIRNGKLVTETELNKTLSPQRTTAIRCDKQGKIWVATYENGIFIFDKNKQFVKHLSQEEGFCSNSVQHLFVDSDDGLWLSTPDGVGYIKDTRHPDNFKLFGYKQGLKDSYIRAITEDDMGNIWISTNNGISMLDRKKEVFYNYNKRDGLQGNNFTGGAVRQTDGTLYFTSLEGVCAFNPRDLIRKREIPAVKIIECISLGSDLMPSQDQLVNESEDGIYHLSHDRNTFKIVFTIADYAQARQVEYAYRLKGRDNSWTMAETNSITFRSMPSGCYDIEVKARHKGQDWTDGNAASMKIVIAQPFWWTWYARTVYALVALLILYIVFRHYQHRLKLKNQLELERRKNIDEQELNKERLQFFTNITHELRTPLTLILGPLEDLKSSNNLTAEDEKKIELIHNNSLRLSNLISKLLEFRKIETHNRKLTVARADLRETVISIGHQFQQSNTNKQVSIVVSTPETPLIMYYDEDVMTIILSNLMSNACKYTPEGRITLSLLQKEDMVEISVSDTGYGIPKESLTHVFERYYQGSSKHQVTGTGIGLAIVKSLVELHEGRITVNSQEGKGTTFELLLEKENTYPAAMHQDSAVLSEPLASSPNITANEEERDSRPILLVVEDNEEIREYIASSMKDTYRVIKAEDGKVGIKKALEVIPDIIVSDIMMPVTDGLELCRILKSDIRTSHIPIILLTAKDKMDDQQEGYQQGADSYLTKPFSIKMLYVRIENLLNARRRMAKYLAENAAVIVPETKNDDRMSGTSLTCLDQQFLDDLVVAIEQNITSSEISMAYIGEKLKISHSTLYRKIKALTGLTGSEYIRKVKLRHSVQLMLNERKNVSEAAYESGFTDLAYFRSCFKTEYGMTPTEYLKKKY